EAERRADGTTPDAAAEAAAFVAAAADSAGQAAATRRSGSDAQRHGDETSGRIVHQADTVGAAVQTEVGPSGMDGADRFAASGHGADAARSRRSRQVERAGARRAAGRSGRTS